ncbi:MAG: hypothetical protein J5606_00040 [Bacteroidales bacterium]|nr:hypothetical protein [Bacteroidales bacterium]
MFGGIDCFRDNNCGVPYITAINNNYKTSVLNVLAEDGFNIYQTYYPNEWCSELYLKRYLLLSQANNFQVLVNAGHYYKPLDSFSGTNIYDNCGHIIDSCSIPYYNGFFRVNINNFIDNIFTKAPYKDIIWGYQICEEASYLHYHHFSDDCKGNIWGNVSYFKNVEIPPTNVRNALSYYKKKLASVGIKHNKMIIMEANHHKNINDNTIDGDGQYNPQQYLKLLDKNDNRDVFFEGSYTQFPQLNWISSNYLSMYDNDYHYLGSFKSIDYAKQYVKEVHKVINIEGTSQNSNYLAHYHSNTKILNANWLWFQVYTSVIHGVQGIWFWDIRYAWNEKEINQWNNVAISNRFDRFYYLKRG